MIVASNYFFGRQMAHLHISMYTVYHLYHYKAVFVVIFTQNMAPTPHIYVHAQNICCPGLKKQARSTMEWENRWSSNNNILQVKYSEV